MPYYKDKNLLFIHIPKTGGTLVEKNIKSQTPQTLYSVFTNTLLDFPYNKISLQHQYYTTIYKFRDKLDVNFDNIKIFSIVRNPYDRIISDLIYLRLIKKNFTAEQVYHVIKNKYIYSNEFRYLVDGRFTYLDNHNVPQYKFLVDENGNLVKNIKIFKTETLNESNDELNKFLGFNINIKCNRRNKDYSNYLNKDSISLINTVYKKDFELFNYKFKTPT